MMMTTHLKIFLFSLLNVVFLVNGATPPSFAKSYTIKGRILLPYAEIDEPFTAYYDEDANKSRVDYYGDLQLTLQRADLKEYYKIAYMVDHNGQSTKVCFNMAGTELQPVDIQSVIPDMDNFRLVKKGNCKELNRKITNADEDCEAWQYENEIGEKVNKYLFILRRDNDGNAIPVFYLMMGYDSLMGSHYDKYEIIYESYEIGKIDPKIFEIHQNYKCRGFPGPGKQAVALMNPIREFILHDYSHVDEHFKKFINQHNKNYSRNHEINYRKFVFLQNYRFIMSQNRLNQKYQLAVNHLADRTDDELGRIRGKLRSNVQDNGGLLFDKSNYDLSKLPDQWDWRLVGAVTPVKDQAICGSCWSFGATGSIEGVYFAKTGKLLKLSQQQLIDCSWSEDNNGCDGGEDFRTYSYIKKAGGIATEEDYGHYLGADGKCHDSSVNKSVKVKGFYNITIGDVDSMKAAMYYHGPINIAIDASQKTFTFYSHGVYYDPNCSTENLDHQVLAVGYGELKGEKYWLIKNSWSTYWGNDGYILINQKQDNCGVLMDATFPIVE